MLLFSPCKRCCPCSDAVLRSCEEALAGIILHRPPSLGFAWVGSGCAGPLGAGAARGPGGRGPGGGGALDPRAHRRVAPPPPQARPFPLARGVAGLPTAHGTTRQGTRGPLPLPLPLPFDTQMRMMATMLCTMTSMCYSQCGCWWYLCSYVALGFGTACSLPYLVANRAWLVMFLRKLY